MFGILGLTCFTTIHGQDWQPFTQTGAYAVKYIGTRQNVRNYFLANPLTFGGSDWDDVLLKPDFVAASSVWNITNEDGNGAMSFRNTQGGKNSGDLIIFKSQIRTSDNAHFDIYKNNQTFQIFWDADCQDSIVCVVKSNYEANRYWSASATKDALSFANTSKEKAEHFRLIPLYRYKDMERAAAMSDSILLDVEKSYDAQTRTALERSLEKVKALLNQLDNKNETVDTAIEQLKEDFEKFKASAKSGSIGSISDLTANERRNKRTLSVTGTPTEEDFRIVRDEMVNLEELDLSATSLTSLPDFALAGHWKIKSIKLPASCTELGKASLMNCPQLDNIDLSHITKINVMALQNTGLTKVMLSSGVSSVGDFAFDGCRNLLRIDVEAGNANYASVDGVLFDKEKKTLIKCPEAKGDTLKLPQSLISVEKFACANAVKIISLNSFPQSLQTIGDYAFDNCQSLQDTLAIPNKVQTIGDGAFWGCKNIAGELAWPENASVGKGSFSFMGNIKTLTIPKTCTQLPDALFDGCSKVEQINSLNQEPPAVGDYTFSGVDTTLTYINVPSESVVKYKNADGWKRFSNYDAPFVRPARFSKSGKYYLQYVGEGMNNHRFVKFNTTYGGKAGISPSLGNATAWELDFFEGIGSPAAFNGGAVADLRYKNGSNYLHVNKAGECYTDAVSGYSVNDNRVFAFYLNEEDGTIAMQSNGYYLTASKTSLFVDTEQYTGTPRPTDYQFKLIPVNDASLSVEVTDLNYATFYAEHAMTIPTGVKAYAGVREDGEGLLKLTEVVNVVPEKTPVVLQANSGKYTFRLASSAGTAPEKNDLVGTVDELDSENLKGYVYNLQKPAGKETGFYSYTGKIPAHSAYLICEDSYGKYEGWRFSDVVSGISNALNDTRRKMIYDLNGKRVFQVKEAGLYIVNGEKCFLNK